jgi:hypothetical protein
LNVGRGVEGSPGFLLHQDSLREFDRCSVPETAFGVHARAGTDPGIRELTIGGTPYIVLYRVRDQRVITSTIW